MVVEKQNNDNLKDPFTGKLFCHACDSCICERVNLINTALGYIEKPFCLSCLGKIQANKEEEIFYNLKEYICSRPCFKANWEKINVEECPRFHSCYCNKKDD